MNSNYYTGQKKYGKIRGKYKLKDVEGILHKNLFLKLVFAIHSGAKSNKDIERKIKELSGSKVSSSNFNKSLADLEKVGILNVDEFKEKGVVGRRKKKYSLNHKNLSGFILRETLYPKIKSIGLKINKEYYENQLLIDIISNLFVIYLDNLMIYYDNKPFSKLMTSYTSDEEDNIIQEMEEQFNNIPSYSKKTFWEKIENIKIKIEISNPNIRINKSKNKIIKEIKPLDINFTQFNLITMIEGFFEHLNNTSIITSEYINHCRRNKIPKNLLNTALIKDLEDYISFYFLSDTSRILANINRYFYDKNDILKKRDIDAFTKFHIDSS